MIVKFLIVALLTRCANSFSALSPQSRPYCDINDTQGLTDCLLRVQSLLDPLVRRIIDPLSISDVVAPPYGLLEIQLHGSNMYTIQDFNVSVVETNQVSADGNTSLDIEATFYWPQLMIQQAFVVGPDMCFTGYTFACLLRMPINLILTDVEVHLSTRWNIRNVDGEKGVIPSDTAIVINKSNLLLDPNMFTFSLMYLFDRFWGNVDVNRAESLWYLLYEHDAASYADAFDNFVVEHISPEISKIL